LCVGHSKTEGILFLSSSPYYSGKELGMIQIVFGNHCFFSGWKEEQRVQ
jgi:hypothetical protein